MDQDSFRQLLQGGSSNRRAAATAFASSATKAAKPAKSKSKKIDSSEPAFKPRAVKKASSYRDRAAERRDGKESDYAQVEALAEDFERRAAAEDTDKHLLDEQRKFLGGDGDHSVLVKGLDFALLEQNKARAVASTENDDDLEQAFIEGSSTTKPNAASGKKRTREEILNELKSKRTKTGDAEPPTDLTLNEAKNAAKFRPIGFKPIGGAKEEGGKVKKKKAKKVKGEEKDGMKKKKKAQEQEQEEVEEEEQSALDMKDVEMKDTTGSKPSRPEPELTLDDFDIFAGAGEYEGLDLGDDDDEEGEDNLRLRERDEDADDDVPAPKKANWFGDKEEDEVPATPPPKSAYPPPERVEEREQTEEVEEEEDAPVRLVPLASSSVPSIRDILAMDDEKQKEEKRKARKEKKKKAGLGTEAKVDRDYQRLESYTKKKAAAG